MKVLVGYDGSDGADDAVALARVLSAGEEGEALLVDVRPLPVPLPVAYRQLGADEVPGAEELFRRPAEALAPLRVSWRSYAGGSPAQVLTDVAAEERPDLLVVGSPHRGVVGRALLGSVALGVLTGSPAPVAVAPRGYAGAGPDSLRRIAVAFDGSAEAEEALARAQGLARRHGAALELLTVTTEPPPAPSLVGFRFGPLRKPGEVIAQGLAAIEEGVEASGREVPAGTVVAGLTEACADADLLVAGSRRYGALGRVLVGSVAREVIAAAPCPVLVTPRPREVKATEGS